MLHAFMVHLHAIVACLITFLVGWFLSNSLPKKLCSLVWGSLVKLCKICRKKKDEAKEPAKEKQ